MRTIKKRTISFLFFALLLLVFPTTEASAAKKASLNNKKITVTKGESQTLKVKNTKKTVKWDILSGKEYIALKKKSKVAVTVQGREEGTAKIRAAVGTAKLTC